MSTIHIHISCVNVPCSLARASIYEMNTLDHNTKSPFVNTRTSCKQNSRGQSVVHVSGPVRLAAHPWFSKQTLNLDMGKQLRRLMVYLRDDHLSFPGHALSFVQISLQELDCGAPPVWVL